MGLTADIGCDSIVQYCEYFIMRQKWPAFGYSPKPRHEFSFLSKPPDNLSGGQLVEEAGVKREQNTGFFEIEGQKEDEGGGNKADGSPATSV